MGHPYAPKSFLLNPLIALLYVLAGYLGLSLTGLFLATPPGQATAVWPAAGIALGAALVFGWEVLPGILLGSLLLNFSTLLNGDSVNLSAVIPVSICSTIGVTLQAFLGRQLIKRYVGFENPLYEAKDILHFAVLAGPVSCLINASLGSLYFYFTHSLPIDSILMNFWTWWSGDSLGSLIFTPLFLIVFKQPKNIWLSRLRSIALPLCICFISTIMVFGIVNHIELKQIGREFSLKTKSKISGFINQISIAATINQSLADRISADQKVSSAELANYTKLLLKEHPYINGISWIPEKILAEASLQEIHSFNNAEIFNNISDQSLLEALNFAQKANNTSLSKPLIAKNNSTYIFIFSPVFTHKQRHGFTITAINTDKLASFTKLTQDSDIFSINILDSGKLLFLSKSETEKSPPKLYEVYDTTQEKVLGRSLIFRAAASEAFIKKHYSPLVWLFLTGSLFFCALMTIILFIIHGQRSLIQAEVDKRTEELSAEQAKNLLLLNSAEEGIYQIDNNGLTTFINPAATKMLGYEVEELLGKHLHGLIHHTRPDGTHYHADDCPMMNCLMTGQASRLHNEMLWRKNGSCFWVDYNCSPLYINGTLVGAMVLFHDVSKQRESELELSYVAHHDIITMLPNRLSLLEALPKAIAKANQNKTFLAICFLDLDNFKQVNDNLGHAIGDALLKAISDIFKSILVSNAFLARIGGDEFALLIENISHPKEVATILGQYVKSLQQPIRIDQIEINTSVSIGATVYPGGGASVETLIKNADIAMYHAKESGRNTFAFFNDALLAKTQRRHELDSAIRHAIERQEFSLCYQPQIDLITQKLCGIEALIRWNNPVLKDVRSDEFIPLAEENGLIFSIGEWVFKQACEDYRKLLEAFPDMDITLSINLSAREIESENYLKKLRSLLDNTKVPVHKLSLEITESALMKYPSKAKKVMLALKAIGIHFALDDFGTGYSSMQYLKDFPISSLKIDKSFIQDILIDGNDAAIVKATIQLAHSLNIKVVAEGVENEEQLQFLVANQCDEAQGYLFSRPIPLDELVEIFYA